jgi:hypothetical protein
VPADQRAGDRLDPNENRRQAAEERAQTVGDATGYLVGVERFGDEPADAGEHLGFPLAPGRLGMQARVVERDRRLVHEGLGQADLVGAEDAAGAAERRERAEDPLAGDERQRQDRAVLEALERGACLGSQRDAGIGQRVGVDTGMPSRTARPTAAVPRGSVRFQSVPTPVLASSTKSPVSRLIRYRVAIWQPRRRPTLSTMRWPTSSGSSDCETSRPTSARTSASRRRLSISDSRLALPIATAA